MMTGLPFSSETRAAYFKAAPPPAPFGKLPAEVPLKMPPGNVMLLRYYYWPADTEPSLDPVPLRRALEEAKSIDVGFASRAPQDLLKVIDKDAFAFQFVRVTNEKTPKGKLLSLFRAQAEYKLAVDPQIYLVGEYDVSRNNELMLRTNTGSFILPGTEAMLLRGEDLRPACCYYDASAPHPTQAP